MSVRRPASGGAKNAMAAFKAMDKSNNHNGSTSSSTKVTKSGQPSMVDGMIKWCQVMTREYQNVNIGNFSTSWNDGLAFLALIHHFYPESFAWEKVDARRRRENFTLAFRLAEQKADITPLLDVKDMVRMEKPDWKCVFTYVQSMYRQLKDHENNRPNNTDKFDSAIKPEKLKVDDKN